ncbi:MAG: hypothetical protein ACJAVI_000200 [Candidatus Azotimanducaceae bacterium]|jgi:uncharacterized protein (DUF924 family)
MTSVDSILSFWIGTAADDPVVAGSKTKLWFMSSPAADHDLQLRFSNLLSEAEQGLLENWQQCPLGGLALVILLDQFSRNIYRGSASAFANDDAALKIAKNIVTSGQHLSLKPIERVFLHMPFEHSESLEIQNQSVSLFKTLTTEATEEWRPQLKAFTDHAIEHREIISKFGRFPHRNKILGRSNTAGENLYLQSAKTFGQ